MPDTVMASSGVYFEKITPKDKGYARKNTDTKGTTILANYAYADRLDNGWSKQFGGKGMTKPTTAYIEKQVNKYVGDL